MAIEYLNRCNGCGTCTRCGRKWEMEIRMSCDICQNYVEELYRYTDQWICQACLLDKLDRMEIGDMEED